MRFIYLTMHTQLKKLIFTFTCTIAILYTSHSFAKTSLAAQMQEKRAIHKINAQEEKVGPYTLPDPLVNPIDGYKASNAFDWLERVRPGLVESFEKLYSPRPPRPFAMRLETLEKGEALEGKALREQIRIFLRGDTGEESYFDLLIYLPKNAQAPVPCFVNMNYYGNHTIINDPKVLVPDCFVPGGKLGSFTIKANKPNADMRGLRAGRHPVENIINSGFAYLTFLYTQVYPDTPDAKINSQNICRIFSDKIYPHKRTAISTWSWALSRVMDYIETNPKLDKDRVAVVGHSRHGKTALLTGALDTRFAMAISNGSGCMGAKLSRRNFGENISWITSTFEHWFADELKKYVSAEDKMPVDQHQLLALLAPRPVYVESAKSDLWADPKGQISALVAANKVYELFGTSDLPTMENETIPFCGATGYHMREGKHDLTEEDWKYFIKFAQKHFKTEPRK